MRSCRVAVIDSGVNKYYPFVGIVIGGINLLQDSRCDDFTDRIGHGTAVAGAIHEKAPDAEILIVKIFESTLASSVGQLVDGLNWALDNGAEVINLSLGSPNLNHAKRLAPIIHKALKQSVRIISARQMMGTPCFPGCMEGVLGVDADNAVPRDEVRFSGDLAVACPYPRPIPGVPPERNLSGVSFAVANVSGFLCAQILCDRKFPRVA